MLVFVRHAQTAHNDVDPTKDRTRGQLALPPTIEGRQTAVDTGQRFRGIPVAEVYSADRPANEIVAQAISNATGAPLTLTPALRSWDIGDLSGQPVATTVEQIRAYMKTPDVAPPGSRESWNQFVGRYLDFLRPHYQQPGYCVLVTNGRNIMVSRAWLAAGCEGSKLDDAVLDTDYSRFVRHGGWVTAAGDRILDGIC